MSELDELIQTLTARRATTLERGRVSLQVIAGRDAGRSLEFDGRARIGTRPLADLVLSDPRVSGLHCEVLGDRELRVRDLGSKNGTWLAGIRVVEAIVPPGETISLGDTRVRVIPQAERVQVALSPSGDFHGVVGQSAPMRALTAQLERLAHSDVTVLVAGETGTGKSRVALALHAGGPRAEAPLLVVECSALTAPEPLADAFARGRGGTLFLDEVGNLSPPLQPALVRVLDAQRECRVIASSNRDLPLEVQRARFREDLYHRLAVVTVTVPPLRERLDDIPVLAVALLAELGVDPASCLTVESLGAMQAYDWPGNVRELANALERAAALGERPAAHAAGQGMSTREPLRTGKQRVIEAFERAYVSALLEETGHNISETARRAGMDRMSIHRILSRLGMRGT